jgi:hypothetical protein
MSKIPFSEQRLPPDHLTAAQTDVGAGRSVTGNELLLAIEQSMQQSLKNMHSDWRHGHFHPAENHDGWEEDYDAEIDRLFPPTPES